MELKMQEQDLQTEQRSIPLPLRVHTIFGVCEAIGEDFGFNPVFLRVPLAAMVLYSPLIAIGAYFALGAVVLLSRLLFPQPKQADQAVINESAPANEQRELAKAA
jgi:phage shock protein PspC (stress-responsive transcriptional regulator)